MVKDVPHGIVPTNLCVGIYFGSHRLYLYEIVWGGEHDAQCMVVGLVIRIRMALYNYVVVGCAHSLPYHVDKRYFEVQASPEGGNQMTPPLMFMWAYVAGFIACSLYTLVLNVINKSITELNKLEVLRDSFIIGILWPIITFYVLLDVWITSRENDKRQT